MKPLISIITPAHNHRPYIEQTIRSVIDQTYRNWEWVILDDGSTDGTGAIINSFKDSRIRYHYQKNAGIAQLTTTYNKILSMCNGEFIAMLDSDDYWIENKLERQIKAFVSPDIVLSYGLCCLVNQKGKKISGWRLPEDHAIVNNDPVGSALRGLFFERYSFIPNLTVMMQANTLKKIGGFVQAKGMFHDFPTWVRLSLEGRFAALPVCLGYYRKHPAAISFDNDQELRLKIRLNFFSEFISSYSKQLNELGFFYDMETIKQRMEMIKMEHFPYVPYNRALLMLGVGLYREAQVNFKIFLDDNPTLKNRLIYSLVLISKSIRHDIVNPIAKAKEKLEEFL